MLLNLFSFCFHIFSVNWFAHFPKTDFYCFGRFCVCMLHEIFTRWLSTLHKIILAHHDDNCECECGFCTSCGDLDTLSIGAFMRLMLCPPSLRFHGSTIPLFDWNCIDNKYDFFPLLVDLWSVWKPSSHFCFSCLTVVICATLTSWKVFSNVLSLVCFMMKERWSIGCMSRLILLNNLLPMQLLAPPCKV